MVPRWTSGSSMTHPTRLGLHDTDKWVMHYTEFIRRYGQMGGQRKGGNLKQNKLCS